MIKRMVKKPVTKGLNEKETFESRQTCGLSQTWPQLLQPIITINDYHHHLLSELCPNNIQI